MSASWCESCDISKDFSAGLPVSRRARQAGRRFLALGRTCPRTTVLSTRRAFRRCRAILQREPGTNHDDSHRLPSLKAPTAPSQAHRLTRSVHCHCHCHCVPTRNPSLLHAALACPAAVCERPLLASAPNPNPHERRSVATTQNTPPRSRPLLRLHTCTSLQEIHRNLSASPADLHPYARILRARPARLCIPNRRSRARSLPPIHLTMHESS